MDILRSTFPGRVLVWGACGFIGRHLVSRMVKMGWDVSVLTKERGRYALPEWAERVDWHELPAEGSNYRVFRKALESTDLVYVFSISGSPRSGDEPSWEYASSVLREQLMFLGACSEAGRRPHIVVASSRQVYGITGKCEVNEDYSPSPVCIYGATALAAEYYYRVHGNRGVCTFTIARITNAYGNAEGCSQSGHGAINKLIAMAARGENIRVFGKGEQLRDYVYIDDVIDGLILCGVNQNGHGQAFNIGLGNSIQFRDAAGIIAGVGAVDVEHVAWPEEYRNAEAGDFICSIGRAKEILGYAPRYDFAKGIGRILTSSARRSLDESLTYGSET